MSKKGGKNEKDNRINRNDCNHFPNREIKGERTFRSRNYGAGG